MWMSDVHSVGGYTFAASLFLFGLTGWQVLLAMAIGILIVYVLMNMIGRPSIREGIPFPVMARVSLGVMGANLAAMIRGVVGIVWYGVQTYFASKAVATIILLFIPSAAALANGSFLGPRRARLGQLPVHVVLPAADLPARHGDDPQVHRLLRPGGLRRDVRADGLDPLPRRVRLAEPDARRHRCCRAARRSAT